MRWVACEVAVRQRPEDEVVVLHRSDDQRALRDLAVPDATNALADQDVATLADGETADQVIGECGRVDLIEVRPDLVGHAGADRERRDRPIEHPLLRILRPQGLREQLLEIHDVDAPVAHQVGERVVLLAGAADPQDVVE
jgi:hypothetical protein